MKGYFHWSQIKVLTIGRALDGSHDPVFQVVLEPGAVQAASADVEGPNAHQYLYVFGEDNKQHYSYLQGDDRVSDKYAYRDVMSDHLKYKQSAAKAAKGCKA
jgi:hypothetical protein